MREVRLFCYRRLRCAWECTIFFGRRWSQSNVTTDQKHVRNFTKVTTIPLKKPKAAKCNDHRTIGINTLSERIVAWILRRRFKRKIEDVFGEDQFWYRRGKGTREAIGTLKIIPVRTLDIDEEMCPCIMVWQKAYDRVNRTKLTLILLMWRIGWAHNNARK